MKHLASMVLGLMIPAAAVAQTGQRGLGRLLYQDIEITESCGTANTPVRTLRLRPGEPFPPIAAAACGGSTLRATRLGVSAPLQTVPGLLQDGRVAFDASVAAGFDIAAEWTSTRQPPAGQVTLSARMTSGDAGASSCEEQRTLAAPAAVQASRVCQWNAAGAASASGFVLQTDFTLRGDTAAGAGVLSIRGSARYGWVAAPELERLEFVQAVQTADARVPLMAGKPTQVRVFVKGDGATAMRARMALRYADGAWETITPRTVLGPERIDRGADLQSFVIPLPEAALKAGAISVDVDLLTADNRLLRSHARAGTAEFADPPRGVAVGFLRVCEADAAAGQYGLCPHAVPRAAALLERVLPAVHVFPLPVVTLPAEPSESLYMVRSEQRLARVRLLLDELQPGASELVTAVLPVEGAAGRRWAGRTWRGLRMALVGGDAGATALQTLRGVSRLLGVEPNALSGTDVGFDIATGEVLAADTAPRFWPGSRMLLAMEAAMRVKTIPPPLAGVIDFLHISGTVRRDGSAGTLGYGFRTTSNMSFPASDAAAPVCLVLTDAGDGVARYCFPVEQTGEESAEEDAFAVRVPWLAGARKAALVVNGVEVASRQLSATPPVLELLSPMTANRIPGDGPMPVIWKASDLDGDPLRFDILFSPDGGSTWMPLAVDIEGTQWVLDPTTLEGATQPMITVRASDGLHTVTATQGPFVLVREPLAEPERRLTAPDLPAGQTAEVEVPVTSTGTASAIIESISSNSPAVTPAIAPLPIAVPPGQPFGLRLRVQPPSLGDYSAQVRVAGPGFNNAAVDVRGRGVNTRGAELQMAVTPLLFGDVAVGRTRDVSIPIGNAGAKLLQILSVAVTEGTPFRVVGGLENSLSILPAGQQNITLRYAPVATGPSTATLTVESSDPLRRSVSVLLAGNAIVETVVAAPRLEVQPAPINFGNVRVGERADQSFTVRNGGDAPLVIRSMSASPDDYMVPDAPPFPLTLQPGQQRILTVRMVAKQSGPRLGGLQIVSNDPARGTVSVGLSAVASLPTTGTVVLAVDDGTFEMSTGFPSGDGFFVNRLTPPAYPATLKAVRIYFAERSMEPGDTITLLTGSHPSGGEELTTQFRPRTTVARVQQQGAFNEYAVPAITIESGDFVVGFGAPNSLTLKPAAVDIHNNLSKKAFASRDGGTWRLIELWAGQPAGVFGIRAVVDLGAAPPTK